jgi:hypothetical protein
MTNDTLIFDVGQTILGIYSVRRKKYVPYWKPDFARGVLRLIRAREIVSYNGNGYDLPEIGKMLGLTKALQISGVHIDMKEMCWPRIMGSSLRNTYRLQFSELPNSDDTYQGANECDIYMTRKLWQRWKAGKLVV